MKKTGGISFSEKFYLFLWLFPQKVLFAEEINRIDFMHFILYYFFEL